MLEMCRPNMSIISDERRSHGHSRSANRNPHTPMLAPPCTAPGGVRGQPWPHIKDSSGGAVAQQAGIGWLYCQTNPLHILLDVP